MSSPRTTAPRRLVLDAGALIALEQADPRMTAVLAETRAGSIRLVVPDPVIAQVWRDGAGRQARVAALLGLGPEQCSRVALDTAAAKRIGAMIRECGHSDVVDVHVVLLAREPGTGVVTSDRDDLLRVDASLGDRILDI